jgi:hypothetical protein
METTMDITLAYTANLVEATFRQDGRHGYISQSTWKGWHWAVSIDDHGLVRVGGLVDDEQEALRQCERWLAADLDTIRDAWVQARLAEIDGITRDILAVRPATKIELIGYAKGRQDGYEAARREIAAAFGLVPSEQFEQADNARIDAERMVDFERDYAATLEDQLGESRTATRAMTPDGELAIVEHQVAA